MSIFQPRMPGPGVQATAGRSESTDRPGRRRWRPAAFVDAAAVALLMIEAAVLAALLRHRLTKAFWYDESWRAYRVDRPGGWWHQIGRSDGPYSAGFAAIERTATALLGHSEWALRLPMWLAIPALAVTVYKLARRLVGPVIACATAATVQANVSVIDFGTQLKPFAAEGLAAVLIVLLWLGTQRAERSLVFRVGCGTGLVVCCLFAIPAVFVLAPLLVFGLVRAARAGRVSRAILPGLAVSVPVALHLALFVAPQSSLSHDPFWTGEYARDAGYWTVLRHGVASVFPELLTGAGRPDSTLTLHLFRPVPPLVAGALTVTLVAALARGSWRCRRGLAGQALLVALAGSVGLLFVASAAGRWPFALERVNLFVVPLLLTVIGAGLSPPGERGARPSLRAATNVASLAVLIAAWALILGTTASKVTTFARIGNGDTDELLERMPDVVATARLHATADTLAVVHPFFVAPSWSWYMNRAGNRAAGQPIPADRTVFDEQRPGFDGPALARNADGDLDALLRRHPNSSQLILFVLPRRHQPTLDERLVELRGRGWCPRWRQTYPHSGILVDLAPCKSTAANSTAGAPEPVRTPVGAEAREGDR